MCVEKPSENFRPHQHSSPPSQPQPSSPLLAPLPRSTDEKEVSDQSNWNTESPSSIFRIGLLDVWPRSPAGHKLRRHILWVRRGGTPRSWLSHWAAQRDLDDRQRHAIVTVTRSGRSTAPLDLELAQRCDLEDRQREAISWARYLDDRQWWSPAVLRLEGRVAQAGQMSVVKAIGRSLLRPGDVSRTYYCRSLAFPRTIKMPTRLVSVASMRADDVLSTFPLVLPLFVHDQAEEVPIAEIRGYSWTSIDMTVSEVVPGAYEMGITKFFLFAKNDNERETLNVAEPYNEDGLVPRTLRMIKESFPDALIFTDIGLEPYGYRSKGDVFSVGEYAFLREQAMCYARAGVDVIGVKQENSGLIFALRSALTAEGFEDVMIMSHSATFSGFSPVFGVEDASFYLPYGREGTLEAVSRAIDDETSGADFILVKPASNKDAISMIHGACLAKIVVFHGAGEYAQCTSAAAAGRQRMVEFVIQEIISLRNQGASFIITYLAFMYAHAIRVYPYWPSE